jgi:hypothetical protein
MGQTGCGWLKREFNGEFYEHSNEPSGSTKKVGYSLTSCVIINFSKNILHHGVIS